MLPLLLRAAGLATLLAPHAAGALPATPQGPQLPDGFVDEVVGFPLIRITSFAFGPGGSLFFTLKKGEVRVLDPGGVPVPTPLLDISDEVGNWNDHGLHGFALDPDYDLNGRIYVYYVVDGHHLAHAGTPAYDPAENEYFTATIARVTRYTVLDPHDPYTQADPASRVVLVGEDAGSGVPVCTSGHGIGWIAFGADGTLLVSAGDAALGEPETDLCTGLGHPKKDISFMRAQPVKGMNGRILRIDPETGDGLPSNPFYNDLNPRSGRSRTWVLGLRNPYRFCLRPGTGSADPEAGDPGALYVGDVGVLTWEELNVAPVGGLNFGWPLYEAFQPHPPAVGAGTINFDAVNPLFGAATPLWLCNVPFLAFADLLVEDSLHEPSWPNPCDPGQELPGWMPKFAHERPVLAWRHGDAGGPEALVPNYGQGGLATTAALGTPDVPVAGAPFAGNCSIGGAWYTGTSYPAQYHGAYFHADFGGQWIRALRFDADHRLLAVEEFATGVGRVTFLAAHPSTGDLYYLRYYGNASEGGSTVHRIAFGGNAAPVAVIGADPQYGPEPLSVSFSAADSSDPEGTALTYAWDFGDGSPPSPLRERPEVVHVFPSEDVTAGGGILSALDELVPPAPMGVGDPSGEVMRDGVYPPHDATTAGLQFDTFHVGPGLQPDKGPLDWIGYEFPGEREFLALIYQEGFNLPFLGGWFETLAVEVRDAATGVWQPVTGLSSAPAYPGDLALSFETFHLRFDPVSGDAIRVVGAPGGPWRFVGAAERRVIASPLQPVGVPQGYTVTLTVTDADGRCGEASERVSINNTPPVAAILGPLQWSTYPAGSPLVLDLAGHAADAEHATASLECAWELALVHGGHLHPEPPLAGCAGQTTLLPHGELGGDPVYWSVQFRVTDPLGLEGTAVHALYPQEDCNQNGLDDAAEIASGAAADADGDGVPDACQRLSADVGLVSQAQGGTQILSLNAGAAHAGRLFLVLGSASGTDPGLPLGSGQVLPLVPDAYFEGLLTGPGTPPLAQALGVLDAGGQGVAQWSLGPQALPPAAVGLSLYHAYLVAEPTYLQPVLASNAVPLTLGP